MIGAKYLWKLPEHSSQAVLHLAASYNLSLPIMQTLVSRGLTTKEDLDSFLFSTFERDVAHPTLLKDAQKAIDRLLQAIKRKEKILICGDYDVDGITSSAMIMNCLLPLGAHINFFLPHRVKDGYGLSAKTVTRAAQNGYTVIITVDNGITAFEAGLEAQKLGIDLIITDHHKPHDHLPVSYAIINPHQENCPYPYKKLAGVGVTFKLMTLLYEQLGKKLPPKIYELMLLGTVADVVPLTGENRFWVRHGLHVINNEESLAFRILKQNMRSSKESLSSTDIGFSIAPQLNALGRLEDPRQGVFFLIGTDEEKIARIGIVLRELNEARKAIQKSIFTDVDTEIKTKKIDLAKERLILATSTSWQPGVIGLVASQLVGTYNRPTILLSVDRQNQAKGSCRSIPNVNIFDLLDEQKDILSSFGGHAQAAGLSLPLEKVPLFKERIEESLAQKIPYIEPKPNLLIDAEITLAEVNQKLMNDLAHLEPFGNENPPPVFCLKEVTLLEQPQLLKDAHVKCLLFAEGIIKPIIFFNRPELYSLLSSRLNEKITFAVQATENHFNGRVSIELQGLDVAL